MGALKGWFEMTISLFILTMHLQYLTYQPLYGFTVNISSDHTIGIDTIQHLISSREMLSHLGKEALIELSLGTVRGECLFSQEFMAMSLVV